MTPGKADDAGGLAPGKGVTPCKADDAGGLAPGKGVTPCKEENSGKKDRKSLDAFQVRRL